MIAISYFHAESSVKEQKDVYEEMEKENNLSGYDDAVGVYDSDRENYARYGGERRTGKKSFYESLRYRAPRYSALLLFLTLYDYLTLKYRIGDRHTLVFNQVVNSFHRATATTAAPPSLEQLERDLIRQALRSCHGRRKAAAEQLGISERTLYRKIKEYGLEDEA